MYVASFCYFFFTAVFFSLSNPIYWLFLILAIIAMLDGLAYPVFRKDNRLHKILVLSFSIVFPVSFVINLIFYLKNLQFEDAQKVVEEKKEEVKKPIYKRGAFFTAIITLVVTLGASFAAQVYATNNFKVEVTDHVLNQANANEYLAQSLNGKVQNIASDKASWSYTMYRPKNATAENKLPVVFIMPGFTRTKATMAQYAVEYSKRGAVCFILDPGCQGATTAAGYYEGEMITSTIAANGLEYLVHYVYKNEEMFPFIDRTRIGAIGHSAGGGNVVTTAKDYAGEDYEESVIKALYISGYIKVGAANNYSNLHCNAVNSYSYYDEGAYRYTTGATGLEVINLRFVNEVDGDEKNIDLNDLKYDTAYGDMSKGTYRMLHRENTNHAFQMYDVASITNTIAFFRESLSLDTKLKDSNQTWFGKELFNGIALVSAFTFVVSALTLLTYIPVLQFKGKKKEEVKGSTNSEEAPKEKVKSLVPQKGSFASKAIFWGSMVLSAIIACLDFIPLARWSMDLFKDAAVNNYTYYFPARMMNAVMLWAVVNGLVGLIIFFGTTLVENLVEFIGAKKDKRQPHYDFSKFDVMKANWKSLLVGLVFAIVLAGVFFGLVQLCYTLFHQDFRFMLISAAPLQKRYIVTWLIYMPLFYIFYLSNSVRVNGSIAREGLKEWQVYLVSAIANSIGLVFMLVVNYSNFFINGEVFYGYRGNPPQEVWLYINMVFALIPLMAILPILNRYLYKKTKNVYVGSLLVCMIFIMMSLSASVSYIPM